MKRNAQRASGTGFAALPRGLLLYKSTEAPQYVLVRARGRQEYWVVEESWTSRSLAAGPFRAEDALRAYRLANTLVPEGCERGPWQTGIQMLSLKSIPVGANEWEPVASNWLPPSITEYEESDFDKVSNELCCSPAIIRPQVRWRDAQDPALEDSIDAALQGRVFPESGALRREWNVHPAGSPVVAVAKELGGRFVVVDVPQEVPDW